MNDFIRDLEEAKELLEELHSWDNDEIENLPKFYEEKAKELKQLVNRSDR